MTKKNQSRSSPPVRSVLVLKCILYLRPRFYLEKARAILRWPLSSHFCNICNGSGVISWTYARARLFRRFAAIVDDFWFDRLYLAKLLFYLESKHALTAPKQFKCGYRCFIQFWCFNKEINWICINFYALRIHWHEVILILLACRIKINVTTYYEVSDWKLTL